MDSCSEKLNVDSKIIRKKPNVMIEYETSLMFTHATKVMLLIFKKYILNFPFLSTYKHANYANYGGNEFRFVYHMLMIQFRGSTNINVRSPTDHF